MARYFLIFFFLFSAVVFAKSTEYEDEDILVPIEVAYCAECKCCHREGEHLPD